ncbi:ABC transporter permease [Desulfoluna spongiiphila]|nr:ABC transporter permease [Desulfoluna spongiiphila]VVS91248.1 abc transporter type 1 transmembrane domain meti-like [Desulfoluna spongiiphila]
MAWINLSPIGKRRVRAFRTNRRAFYSFVFFSVLFALSLMAEIIANDSPLLVRFQGRWYLPVIHDYPETDFGGVFETTADFTDPQVRDLINAQGWMLRSPIRFHYDTVNFERPVFPAPPNGENLLGTDDHGRDIFVRLLYGFRTSVTFGMLLTLFSSAIGVTVGAVQGYFGGKIDMLGQRLMEIWSGMPLLYILIIISSFIEPGFWVILGIMLLFSWMGLVDVVRAEFLRCRNLEYVRAARALGIGDRKIMWRHVLPNSLISVFSFLPFILSGSITTLTSLDFLGFGLPPGSPALGELLAQGKANQHAPWIGLSAFVVLALMLSLLVFIGEGVRDAFDPRHQVRE